MFIVIKRMKQQDSTTICYTGVGANRSGFHSDAEFLALVERQELCDKNCPKTIDEWIEWYGADRKKKSQCKKVIELNKHISAQFRKTQQAYDKLKQCIKTKCDYVDDVVSSGVCISKNCAKEVVKAHKSAKTLDNISAKAERVWRKK